MTANGSINNAAPFLRPAPNDGHIFLPDRPLLELRNQTIKGFPMLGDHHDSGRILIQTVNDARALFSSNPTKVRAMVKKGIDQSPARIPRRRMNDHSGRFVHNDAVFVLMNDIDRKRLGFQQRLARLGPFDFEQVTRTEPRARPRLKAVKPNLSLSDQPLRRGAAYSVSENGISQVPGQKGIQPAPFVI
jgi:hypothetical protein